MNKKFVQSLPVLFLLSLLISPNLAMATEGTPESEWSDVVVKEDFALTATLHEGAVNLGWHPVVPDGFTVFKILRSAANANPAYPEDPVIGVSDNPARSEFTDTNVPAGTLYYRICSLARPVRYCSNVVTIVKPAPAEEEEDTTSDEEDSSDDEGTTDDTNTGTENRTITVTAVPNTDGVVLEWTTTGEMNKGFKLLRSETHEDPTFPAQEGDKALYLGNAIRRFVDPMVLAGKTYHYRVCAYNGEGGCALYSNSTSVTIASDFVGRTETSKMPLIPKGTMHEGELREHEGESDNLQALRDEIARLKSQVGELRAAFQDVKEHAYHAAIDYLREKKVVQGYDDGTFRPDNEINRAEFLKIVMGDSFLDELTDEERDCFGDVAEQWFAPYVCLAKAKGIVSGYDDGEFRPENPISFVEAAKILAGVYGVEVGDQGGQWYDKYVRGLQRHHYIPSSVDRLNKSITRAEMAELIWRIREAKTDQESTDLVDEGNPDDIGTEDSTQGDSEGSSEGSGAAGE